MGKTSARSTSTLTTMIAAPVNPLLLSSTAFSRIDADVEAIMVTESETRTNQIADVTCKRERIRVAVTSEARARNKLFASQVPTRQQHATPA